MKVIYIIGPFTAASAWGIEQNVRAAEKLALQVAELGGMPLCPHANTRYFHGMKTPEFWYEGTMELARRSDAGIVLPTWKSSTGSCKEVADFHRRGAPVFETLEALSRWLRGRD